MNANTDTPWRAGDIEGKTWCVYRWIDNCVENHLNAAGKTLRFRSRAAATRAAERMNAVVA